MKTTTSKSQEKFERVMHEFAQHKLKSRDKPVTDKRQALAIAFSEARKVNPNYGVKRMMKEGGIAGNELQKIYTTGTSKQLWEAWSPNQRSHFIIDHSGEFFELMDEDFTKSANAFITLTYDTLPSPIRKSLIIHHAMGIYKKGGPIETTHGIDLFEDYENIPAKVQKILDKYAQGFEDGDYAILKKALEEVQKQGYTFEYYLDGQAYDLRKIGEMGKVEYAEKNSPIKMENAGIVGEHITGIGIGQKMRLAIYKKDNIFSVYNEKNEKKLSGDYDDLQQAKAFMQGIEQGYESKYKPEYVKGRYHLVKVNNVILLKSDRKEVADAYIDGFDKSKTIKLNNGGIINSYRDIPYNEVEDYADEKALNITDNEQNFKEAAIMLFNEKYATKLQRLSSDKKAIHNRINTLKDTKASAGEAAQKAIQKKIDKLQAELDYNPSSKQKVKDNQGKFALDVPEDHSKYIYKKLWSMNILPKVLTLGDKASIVVNSKINLDKAYNIYSDRMKDKKQKPLPIAKISRKL